MTGMKKGFKKLLGKDDCMYKMISSQLKSQRASFTPVVVPLLNKSSLEPIVLFIAVSYTL